MSLSSRQDGEFEIKPLPILGRYNKQRFNQWSPEDSVNWYLVKDQETKQPFAMYPSLGRAHVNLNDFNQLIFGTEPRGMFKTIKYSYFVIGNTIYRVDSSFIKVNITNPVMSATTTVLATVNGPIYFDFLVAGSTVFACFVDDQFIYIYKEDDAVNGLQKVNDPNAPGVVTDNGVIQKPGFISTFGNRIGVSIANSSRFYLSQINLGGNSFATNTCFTTAGAAVFAEETGIIRQMGVLNNTLYIFTDYTTGAWSNRASTFNTTGGGTVSFPWNKNSTYDWNFGIANAGSLSIDFGRLVFLAQNTQGLLQFMVSTGGQPELLSSKAVNTLLQNYTNSLGAQNPFLQQNANGFLYQYEDTVKYRVSGGQYYGYGILDQTQNANSIEYDFDTDSWGRVTELNGERNRIRLHIYFNFMHLVSVIGDGTVYNMSGQYYYNEIRNPNQSDEQATDAYIAYPFRYEKVTPIVFERDYAEFETEYVEIDMVWGDSDINYSSAPFENAQFLVTESSTSTAPVFIIDEQSDSDGQPIFILGQVGNTPGINDKTYNYLFKPTVELWYSDDGGISFNSADYRQFSQMGVYQWKMRWYQLGCSRNRVYKLICVSPVPMVILGGVMNMRRVSGGAN